MTEPGRAAEGAGLPPAAAGGGAAGVQPSVILGGEHRGCLRVPAAANEMGGRVRNQWNPAGCGAAAAGNLYRDLAFSGGCFPRSPGQVCTGGQNTRSASMYPSIWDQSACCCKARARAGEGAKEEREAGRGEEPRVLT